MTDRKIKMSKKYLPIIAPFMGKNDVRRFLNGFFVEPHPQQGILIVATDGVVMAVVHDKEGSTNGQWICAPSKELIADAKKKIVDDEFIEFTKDRAILDGRSFISEPVDSKYVDYRKPLKDLPSTNGRASSMVVNLSYVRVLEPAIKASSSKYSGVRFQGSKTGPCLAKINGLPEFFAVIMPMKVDIEPGLPDWFSKPKRSRKKAA